MLSPTFASYFPEQALEEFEQCQRREDQFALRRLRLRAESGGRVLHILAVGSSSWPAVSLELELERDP